MAYNSDGYIMIDFTEVDFRRTNQTIEGLYKRCVDVIGTNKFILVINANGRTPLPATCSFTNNQYVIDTCIYMFAISSNDNLFIRRNDVPASDIIDDTVISVDKTWSSNKIDTGLTGKQDVLTAGENINIVDNVISAKVIKSFSYTGNDNLNNIIMFDTIPQCVFIQGNNNTTTAQSGLILYGISKGTTYVSMTLGSPGTSLAALRSIDITYSDNVMTLIGGTAARALNSASLTYMVYYI